MELALNLFWLLVVLGAFGLWLRRPYYRGRKLESRWEWVAAVLALACILFLVFPVISISDDVRAAREFLEDPTADQPLVKSSELQKKVPLGEPPAAEAVLAHPHPGSAMLRTIGVVCLADVPAHEFDPATTVHGRSPPLA